MDSRPEDNPFAQQGAMVPPQHYDQQQQQQHQTTTAPGQQPQQMMQHAMNAHMPQPQHLPQQQQQQHHHQMQPGHLQHGVAVTSTMGATPGMTPDAAQLAWTQPSTTSVQAHQQQPGVSSFSGFSATSAHSTQQQQQQLPGGLGTSAPATSTTPASTAATAMGMVQGTPHALHQQQLHAAPHHQHQQQMHLQHQQLRQQHQQHHHQQQQLHLPPGMMSMAPTTSSLQGMPGMQLVTSAPAQATSAPVMASTAGGTSVAVTSSGAPAARATVTSATPASIARAAPGTSAPATTTMAGSGAVATSSAAVTSAGAKPAMPASSSSAATSAMAAGGDNLTAEQREQRMVALTMTSMQPGSRDGSGQQQRHLQHQHQGQGAGQSKAQHQQMPASSQQYAQHIVHSQASGVPFTSASMNQDGSSGNVHIKQEQTAALTEMASNGAFGGHRRLKVEDALTYLDRVKAHFGSQPTVYNSFLNIMKDFKSQNINTPDVIKNVSQLFEGHPELIVGFNTFLPPGYKIEIPDESQPEQIVVSQPRKQLEFSHAIQYVNKIKTRFQSNSEVYKTFRKILDTYQKEQKTISEVYEQLAKLFENHIDLLEEFSQFLPEAIPAAKAYKERQLQEAARQQQKRKAEAPKQTQQRAAASAAETDEAQPTKRAKEERRLTGVENRPLSSYVLTDELQFFDNVKRLLQPRPLYDDFLRCLNLYNNNIISREELVTVASNFLDKYPSLLRWFRRFVGVGDDGEVLDPHQHDIDLNTCLQVEVSYRRLPDEFQHAQCSGRKNMDPSLLETLNNRYVSFPSWTSEDNQFVTGKKTQYEDNLFKAEDERFELDMLLATNQSTINALQTCYRECRSKTNAGETYTLDTKQFGTNSHAIHHRSLKRLYGEHLEEVLNGLASNPLKNLPIIISRLSQKQKEWKEVQFSWNREWKLVFDENYLRALDQIGPSSKKKDLNELKPKAIRQGFKEQAEARAAYFARLQEQGASPPGDAPLARRVFDLPKTNAMDAFLELFKAAMNKHAEKACDKQLMIVLFKTMAGFVRGDDISEGVSALCPVAPAAAPAEEEHEQQEQPQQQQDQQEQPQQQQDQQSSSQDTTAMDASQDTSDSATTAAATTTEGGATTTTDTSTDAADTSTDAANTSTTTTTKEEDTQEDSKDMETMPDAKTTSTANGIAFEVQLPDLEERRRQAPRSFFTSTKWAIAFVLFETLYERIARVKELCELTKEAAKLPPSELANIDPAIALAVKLEGDVAKDQHFEQFMACTKDLIASPADQSAYEEAMRKMFVTHAHRLYSIDRLFGYLFKQMYSVVLDHSSLHLLRLHQERFGQSAGIGSAYHKAALDHLEDRAALYKVTRTGEHLSIELIGDGKVPCDDDIPDKTSEWAKYVEKYVKYDSVDSDLLDQGKAPPFLTRSYNQAGVPHETAMDGCLYVDRLNARFLLGDYRLRMAPNGWDVFARPGTNRSWSDKKHVAASAAFHRQIDRALKPEQRAPDDKLFLGPHGTHMFSTKTVNGVTVRMCTSANSTDKTDTTTSKGSSAEESAKQPASSTAETTQGTATDTKAEEPKAEESQKTTTSASPPATTTA
ncbi:hypothetical protein PTSG_10955 [Salpingoeca rosetta]|uniref:Histone deacetylase interacting domain-containing protein n=1 Tax=Salpingoeca rosetta (strain ATCC 50818 / BSB-021) TaxID=946362 RepID=F2USA2_SALR5|nr:uncharacterized protein PTSG_10955 [Salpingoeca rosetta]EGD81011.1 hypothetical protein PTSG_10955 [Salpingoeca rosetta]|eukprot:XP_004987881.1 hypothetical protein PTSG_10955 [Salpingoeca rosetta]